MLVCHWLTELQRIFHLVQWRSEEESRAGHKLTAGQLWAAFNSNLTVTHGEKITESYSKLAIQIHDNLLTNASIRSLLLSSEQWFGKKGPLDSLYKLEAISQIARSPAHVEFVLSGLFDHVVNKVIRIGDVSVSALSGRKSAVGKGLPA